MRFGGIPLWPSRGKVPVGSFSFARPPSAQASADFAQVRPLGCLRTSLSEHALLREAETGWQGRWVPGSGPRRRFGEARRPPALARLAGAAFPPRLFPCRSRDCLFLSVPDRELTCAKLRRTFAGATPASSFATRPPNPSFCLRRALEPLSSRPPKGEFDCLLLSVRCLGTHASLPNGEWGASVVLTEKRLGKKGAREVLENGLSQFSQELP